MKTSFNEEQNKDLMLKVAEVIGEEMLKTAMDQCDTLPADASTNLFADRLLKIHPTFTKETALASFVYTKLAGDEQKPAVESKIAAAAIKYGHTELVEMFNAAAVLPEDVVKIAYDENIDWALNDGEAHAYPLLDYSTTIDSAKKIAFDYSNFKLPAPLMKTASAAVLTAMGRHNVETYMVPDVILKHASTRMSNLGSARHMIKLRVSGLNEVDAEEAEGLYSEILKVANETEDSIDIAATLVQEVDRTYGIKYSAHKPDPLSWLYDDRTLDERVKQASTDVLLLDTQIPTRVFAGIVDRLPLPAFFDENVTTRIKSASDFAHRGDGIEASAILQDLPRSTQEDLGRRILQAA